MPTPTGPTPALEIIDLRVSSTDTREVVESSTPRRTRNFGAQVRIATLLCITAALGVFVGSHVQRVPGGGLALRLTRTPQTGITVDPAGAGALATVIMRGPVSVEATPGRLLLDGIRRIDLIPTNHLLTHASAQDLVLMTPTGAVMVVPERECTPVHVVLGPKVTPPSR